MNFLLIRAVLFAVKDRGRKGRNGIGLDLDDLILFNFYTFSLSLRQKKIKQVNFLLQYNKMVKFGKTLNIFFFKP